MGANMAPVPGRHGALRVAALIVADLHLNVRGTEREVTQRLLGRRNTSTAQAAREVREPFATHHWRTLALHLGRSNIEGGEGFIRSFRRPPGDRAGRRPSVRAVTQTLRHLAPRLRPAARNRPAGADERRVSPAGGRGMSALHIAIGERRRAGPSTAGNIPTATSGTTPRRGNIPLSAIRVIIRDHRLAVPRRTRTRDRPGFVSKRVGNLQHTCGDAEQLQIREALIAVVPLAHPASMRYSNLHAISALRKVVAQDA
mmetsp:Transcript_29866/g.77346  ORF Transcript_29866/g.77346 Transcript_29866/m.77346 type:complete len:257 (-) Transcript_29866:1101-1871(-)